MVNLFSTKVQKQFSGAKESPLKKKKKTNGTGTIEYACAQNRFRPLPHTVHKNELKHIIGFNVRGKSIKLLEENATLH